MAIIRENLEMMAPGKSVSDGGRQSKITFFGFNDGDNDFNDVTSGVGPTFHNGVGLNDCTIGGVYTASTTVTYLVKITTTGTPDKFQYSDDGGSTFNGTDLDVTNTGPIGLSNGVTTTFLNTTGHTLNEFWTSTVIQPLTTLTTPIKMAEIEVNHEGTSADQKARMIIRTNEGGAVGTVSVHANGGGSPSASDVASGGTYTGGPTPVVYYIKITGNGSPDTFAWSTDNAHYSSNINITGSDQTIEKGLTVNFAATTGHQNTAVYKFTVGADTIKLHSNADFQCSGHVVSENGFLPKIFAADGTTHLNSYS